MKKVILFKLTTRNRPHQAIRCLQSIIKNCVGPAFIRVSSDLDAQSGLLTDFCNRHNLQLIYGKSTGKINAINRDMDIACPWDILVNVSDDQVFTVKGFDDIIRSAFTEEDLFLHIPDGNRSDFSTMSIMDRAYYNRDGFIYNPVYISLSCDVEATYLSRLRGRYKYHNVRIMQHLHPAFRKARTDDLYKKNNSYAKQDMETFNNRLAINFGHENNNYL